MWLGVIILDGIPIERPMRCDIVQTDLNKVRKGLMQKFGEGRFDRKIACAKALRQEHVQCIALKLDLSRWRLSSDRG